MFVYVQSRTIHKQYIFVALKEDIEIVFHM